MSPFLVFFNKLRLKVCDASPPSLPQKAPLILICPLQALQITYCTLYSIKGIVQHLREYNKICSQSVPVFGNFVVTHHFDHICAMGVLRHDARSTFRCDIINSHCAIKEQGPKKDSVSLDCSVSMTQIHNCLIRVSNTQWTNIIFQLYCSYAPLV